MESPQGHLRTDFVQILKGNEGGTSLQKLLSEDLLSLPLLSTLKTNCPQGRPNHQAKQVVAWGDHFSGMPKSRAFKAKHWILTARGGIRLKVCYLDKGSISQFRQPYLDSSAVKRGLSEAVPPNYMRSADVQSTIYMLCRYFGQHKGHPKFIQTATKYHWLSIQQWHSLSTLLVFQTCVPCY